MLLLQPWHPTFPNTHAHTYQPVPTPISPLSSVSQLKCHFLPEDFYSCPTPSGTHGSLKFPKTFQVMTILYSYLLQLPMVQPKALPVEAWGTCGFVSEDCPVCSLWKGVSGFCGCLCNVNTTGRWESPVEIIQHIVGPLQPHLKEKRSGPQHWGYPGRSLRDTQQCQSISELWRRCSVVFSLQSGPQPFNISTHRAIPSFRSCVVENGD